MPRSIGPLTALSAITPRRLRELMMRVIGADRVLWVDPSERAGYEVRATRWSSLSSAPASRVSCRSRAIDRPFTTAQPVKRSVGRRRQVRPSGTKVASNGLGAGTVDRQVDGCNGLQSRAPLRVIVADDDALVRRVLRDVLQRAGIVVIAEAGGGREAVELSLYYKPEWS